MLRSEIKSTSIEPSSFASTCRIRWKQRAALRVRACAGAAESAGAVDEDDAELQQALLLSLQPLALPNVRPHECHISHAFQRML